MKSDVGRGSNPFGMGVLVCDCHRLPVHHRLLARPDLGSSRTTAGRFP